MNDRPKTATTNPRPNKGSQKPPKDDPSGHPLTDDEKIDEAIRESFGTSDPPSYSGSTGVGAPSHKSKTDKKNKK